MSDWRNIGTPKTLREAAGQFFITPMSSMTPSPDVYCAAVIQDFLSQHFTKHMDSSKPEVYAEMKALWKSITGEDLP